MFHGAIWRVCVIGFWGRGGLEGGESSTLKVHVAVHCETASGGTVQEL